MLERVQLCQDPQTEFALVRESLGVSRVNHIFRVHGHTILEEETAARTFDEVGLGVTRKGSFQGSQKTVQSKPRRVQASQVLDVKDQWTVACPAHKGAVIAAIPWKRDMIRDAINAGLVVARLSAPHMHAVVLAV